MRVPLLSCALLLPAVLCGQAVFEIPSEGFVGYRDMAPLRVRTLMQDGESPDLELVFGVEAISVLVSPELIADDYGHIGGVVALSWLDESGTPRLLEWPATGRLRMRTVNHSDFRFPCPSQFRTEWEHHIDIQARGREGSLRIVGHSIGQSATDPTLSREWTWDLSASIEGLGEASALAMVRHGNEAVARFGISEGVFGADNSRLEDWSGDAILLAQETVARGGGTMTMNARYFDEDDNRLGTFFLRAENNGTRLIMSGWLPVTYGEAALAVQDGTFDFATLGLLPTNQLFATPAYTTLERTSWDAGFWDRGQIQLPTTDW